MSVKTSILDPKFERNIFLMDEKIASSKKSFRILLHIAFWVAITLIFIKSKDISNINLFLSWFRILLVCAVVVYLNLYLLLPKLFFNKKYLFYFLALPALLISGALVIYSLSFINTQIIDTPFFDNLKNLFFFVVITSSLKFYRENMRKQTLLSQMENKQLQTELALLKLQVNPHFLFNTLNNLYAINLENHEKANEMILQLADILRFQLSVSQKTQILLSDEIQLIENYITLEKIRLYNSVVNLIKIGEFGDYDFPPLLLLPLVENAFKHGKKYFSFKLQIINNHFIFESENEIQMSKVKKYSTGLGLANVKKRLELVYPDRSFFNTFQDGNLFKTILKVDL